jgi:hypothetical protein
MLLAFLLSVFLPLLAMNPTHADRLKDNNKRFKDNKDGTVTDKETGLMWEMKLAADGLDGGNCADPIQANRDIHCANNFYSWTSTADADTTNPDGTVFTEFLSTLNQDVTDDASSTCYASYCDWRLPRLDELRTILIEQGACYTAPCIDDSFRPTSASFYWSGTSGATNPGAVWGVNFGAGVVTGALKDSSLAVRAVRGGR